MSELKSWTIEKTTVITVEGNPIGVSTLPKDIQFQIETFDKFKQEYADLMYEQEKLRNALEGKNAKIQAIIREHMRPKEQKDNTGDTNDIRKE